MPAESRALHFQELLPPGNPPELGPGPRAGVLSQPEITEALDVIFANLKLKPAQAQLVRALVLLWHDHLDAAHVISQEIHDADGSYLHGIVHRREPDYWNSKYWFHRVGNHPAFANLAARAGFGSTTSWDADAFVDACEAAARKPTSDPEASKLRAVQETEFRVLLEYFLG
jgi:hypothetical protein